MLSTLPPSFLFIGLSGLGELPECATTLQLFTSHTCMFPPHSALPFLPPPCSSHQFPGDACAQPPSSPLAALHWVFTAAVELLLHKIFPLLDAITFTKLGNREARPDPEKRISSLVWDKKGLALLTILGVSSLIGSSRWISKTCPNRSSDLLSGVFSYSGCSPFF